MGWTRRRFVVACGAAGAAAALSGCAFPQQPPAPRRVEYLGAALVSGPATRGVPLLPLRADAEGRLMGVARPASQPGGVLEWYASCSRDATASLQPGFRPEDEFLRYFTTPEKRDSIRQAGEDWWLERVGQPARTADFAQVGHGAQVVWRSVGQTGKNLLTFAVVKLRAADLSIEGADEAAVRRDFLVPAGAGAVLAAYHTSCPHFCCVMGWHESALARHQGMWDTLFCTCHLVVCDPLRIGPDFFLRGEAMPP